MIPRIHFPHCLTSAPSLYSGSPASRHSPGAPHYTKGIGPVCSRLKGPCKPAAGDAQAQKGERCGAARSPGGRVRGGVGLGGGPIPWRLRPWVGGTRRVVAAPALFAECDVVIVRRHRRWAWGSREGKQEEEGEVVEVEAEAEQEAAAAGRPRAVGILN